MKSIIRTTIYLIVASLFLFFLYKFDVFGFKTNLSFDFIDRISFILQKPVARQTIISEELKIQKDKNAILEREINNLKRELSTREDYTQEYIEAQIVNYEGDKLIINHGSSSGIVPNQKVVVGKSLVGIVLEVQKSRSLVGLLNNMQIKIYCFIEHGGQKVWGLITGRRSQETIFTKITLDKTVAKGDQVFCEGSLAGGVTEIVKNESDLFYEAAIKTAVNPEYLETVWVVADK